MRYIGRESFIACMAEKFLQLEKLQNSRFMMHTHL